MYYPFLIFIYLFPFLLKLQRALNLSVLLQILGHALSHFEPTLGRREAQQTVAIPSTTELEIHHTPVTPSASKVSF
jgi:hypothetical protein